jgi:hypothetical protein
MGVKYKKPSGMILEVNYNQATREYVESLGWTEVKVSAKSAKPKAPAKKAARKKK